MALAVCPRASAARAGVGEDQRSGRGGVGDRPEEGDGILRTAGLEVEGAQQRQGGGVRPRLVLERFQQRDGALEVPRLIFLEGALQGLLQLGGGGRRLLALSGGWLYLETSGTRVRSRRNGQAGSASCSWVHLVYRYNARRCSAAAFSSCLLPRPRARAAGGADAAGIRPEQAAALRALGLAQLENERPGEAAETFLQLATLTPDDPLP